ncbi:unnamed protein product [Hermetia illucens]|uniref:Uncharacterized protein n=1 Tax=Hermetia illucens TaxID=343691 RepID=A0A7R8Z0Y2_HERIL|nr:unnamed protein product [Hermetia illucens]
MYMGRNVEVNFKKDRRKKEEYMRMHNKYGRSSWLVDFMQTDYFMIAFWWLKSSAHEGNRAGRTSAKQHERGSFTSQLSNVRLTGYGIAYVQPEEIHTDSAGQRKLPTRP